MWYKLKKIYIWTNQVRPSWWQPWANTIAYYPLDNTNTVNDLSGNNHTLTNVWNVSFDSLSTTFNWSNYLYCSPLWETVPFTVSFYLYITDSSWDSVEKWLVRHTWGNYYGWSTTILNHSSMPHTKDIRVWTEPNNNCSYTSSTPSNWWHNIVVVCDSTNMKLYVDWVFQSNNTAVAQTWTWWYFTIWTEYWTSFDNNYKWKISKVIVESIERTAQEIADYYDQTKSLYWIS